MKMLDQLLRVYERAVAAVALTISRHQLDVLPVDKTGGIADLMDNAAL